MIRAILLACAVSLVGCFEEPTRVEDIHFTGVVSRVGHESYSASGHLLGQTSGMGSTLGGVAFAEGCQLWVKVGERRLKFNGSRACGYEVGEEVVLSHRRAHYEDGSYRDGFVRLVGGVGEY